MAAPASDVPLHLAGNNAPVADEVTVVPTEVEGSIPGDLAGLFVRNGPNPRTGWSSHLFEGDGMVHGLALAGGTARWYRNRYVRTPLYQHPGVARHALAFDAATNRVDHRITTANTHVVAHAGRLLALEEGGFPYLLTPTLDTVGPYTFGGALRTPMTAHPKVCPATGELLFFGYQLRPPYLTYHRASASGRLLASVPVTLPAATMMHDFAITGTRVVFADSPIVFDPAALAAGGGPWRWDAGHQARLGVMPRAGGDGEVRWFDVEPGHLSHTANAYDRGDDEVLVTGTRLAPLDGGSSTAAAAAAAAGGFGGGLPTLYQWRLDLATGAVREGPVDDTAAEYPRIAEDRVGRSHRYAYAASFVLDAEPDRAAVHRYDLADGAARSSHHLPRGHTCGEAVFVASGGAASPPEGGREDDGYLLSFAHDRGRGTSYLLVLAADDIGAEPVARVHLPVRVPGGFHGSWIPDEMSDASVSRFRS